MADTGIVCSYCENRQKCFQYEELQDELYTLFLRHRNYPRRAPFCLVCIGRGKQKLEHEKRKIQKSKFSSEYSSESIQRRSRREFLDTASSVGSERQLRDIGNIEGRRPIAANPATHKPNEPASDSSGSSNVSASQVLNIGDSENSNTLEIIEPISSSPEKPVNISIRSKTREILPKIMQSPQPGPSNQGKIAEKRKAAFAGPKSAKRRLAVEEKSADADNSSSENVTVQEIASPPMNVSRISTRSATISPQQISPVQASGQHVSPREERQLHRETARLDEESRLAEENERREKQEKQERQKKEMEEREKQRQQKEKEEEKKRKQHAELEQQRIQKERDEQQQKQAKRLKELAEKRKQEQEERARRERAVQQVARRIIVPPDDSDSDDNESISSGSLTIAPIPSNRRLRDGTLPAGHIPYTLSQDLNNYPRHHGG